MGESQHQYDPGRAKPDRSAEVIPLRPSDAEQLAPTSLDYSMPTVLSRAEENDRLNEETFRRVELEVAAEEEGIHKDPFAPKKEGESDEQQ